MCSHHLWVISQAMGSFYLARDSNGFLFQVLILSCKLMFTKPAAQRNALLTFKTGSKYFNLMVSRCCIE